MSLDVRELFERLIKERRYPSLNELCRDLFNFQLNLYNLPPSMAERVREDMDEKGMDVFQYTQELYGERFRQLEREDAQKGRRKTGK